MPLIDIRTIPVAVINLPFQERRRNRVAAALDSAELNYRFVPGVQDRPRHRGCSKGHLAAIESCLGKAPFLILEDDVALTDWYSPTVDVPDGCGFYYLGHSPFGNSTSYPFGDFGTDLVERLPDGRIKVHSMLAAHAIL